MKMNLLIFLLISFTACGQQNKNDSDMAEKQEEYDRHKQYFEPSIISYFPKELQANLIKISSNLDVENNNVGFLLFEFEVDNRLLDSIIESVEKMKIVRKYKSNDTNLLYVIPNRMEYESPNLRRLDTSIKYSNQLPIVDLNFYLENDKYFGKYINNDFDIYVIEAKPGKLPQYADLDPNMNMPEEWRNGFSRGISISKEGKVVVYWTIIW